MDITWIVEKDVFNDETTKKLIDCVKKDGNNLILTDCQFMTDKNIKNIPKDSCTIIYGSLNLMQYLSKNNPKNICPLYWYDNKNFDCQTYYSYWGEYLLQKEYAFYTWSELKRLYENIFYNFSSYDELFIRPSNNLKTFSGKVVKKEEFNKWWNENNSCYSISPDLLVLIAKPEFIIREKRLVIVDRKIITESIYKDLDPKFEEFSLLYNAFENNKFLNKVLSDWQPSSAYTLDIAVDGNGNYKVLEIGSVNTSALYNCDIELYNKTLNDLAIKEWREIYE